MKTIRILLFDESASGLKIAEVGGRNIRALVIPRNKLKESGSREELQEVGLYFLIGENSETNLPEVYIGEAENLYKRLLQHNKDANKDFWNMAICFVSKDDFLSKTHVKYLENICHQEALNVKRCVLINSTSPTGARMSEMDLADITDYFNNLKILISTLGFPIFDSIGNESEAKNIYFCKGPHANARGEYTDEGLVVFQGSLARRELTKTAGSWVEGSVNKLIEAGILKIKDNDSYEFTANYVFKSPSAAAATILARRANGWIEWVDKSGKTLDDNIRK